MGQGHERAPTSPSSAPPAAATGTSAPELQPRGNAFAQDALAAQGKVITMPEMVIEGDAHAGEEVDDARVQEWIDECYAASNFPQEPDHTRDAWAHALNLRRDNPQDVNLAAAEHYLYAKYSGKEDGAFGAITTGLMATGYDAVKAGAFLFGVEDWLSTDGTKPSKPTLGSTRWGLAGAADGLGDD